MPSDQRKLTKVLITVMTYPHPSETYTELVCTAGITDAHQWVRLYPIDYRYRPVEQQFKKYQWIEVDLEGHAETRGESSIDAARSDDHALDALLFDDAANDERASAQRGELGAQRAQRRLPSRIG